MIRHRVLRASERVLDLPWVRRMDVRSRRASDGARDGVWNRVSVVLDEWRVRREVEECMELEMLRLRLSAFGSLLGVCDGSSFGVEVGCIVVGRIRELNERLDAVIWERWARLNRRELVEAMDAGNEPEIRRIDRELAEWVDSRWPEGWMKWRSHAGMSEG